MELYSTINLIYLIMLKRTLEKVIKQISSTFPVLMLTGPRQVGKTTLLMNIKEENREYITLDDLEQRQLAQNDPVLFLQIHKVPMIIDEIQYAPNLFSYIKIHVDKNQKNGDFWLTGSQKFNLMKGIQESLAGRVAIIDMLGLSNKEIENKADNSIPFLPTFDWLEKVKQNEIKNLNIDKIYEKILLGSFPKVLIEKDISREYFYSSYLRTYIERDVMDILNVSDNIKFYNFIRAVACRTGQLLNYTDIAKDIEIDTKTAKSWLSILETSGLVKLLEPYYNNITKRIIKTPKLYFLDTGLCCFLTGWNTVETLRDGAMAGAMLETYVFCEILKSYWNNGKMPFIYFYRDTNQKEIDFLIEENGTLYPIEVKKTATPSLTTTKSFSVLNTLNKKIGTGAVMCLRENDIPLSRDVLVVPVWYV